VRQRRSKLTGRHRMCVTDWATGLRLCLQKSRLASHLVGILDGMNHLAPSPAAPFLERRTKLDKIVIERTGSSSSLPTKYRLQPRASRLHRSVKLKAR